MIFKIIGIVIILGLLWFAYTRFPPAPARISQTVPAYDNQFEVFRDMEPADQTRENPWLGFLQEDVRQNRTGPIGDFIGNESPVPHAPLYTFETMGPTIDTNSIPSCKLLTQDLSNIPPSTIQTMQQNCENDVAKEATAITYAVT